MRPADSVPASAFIAAFNAAYRNYYRPISLSASGLQSTIAREAVALQASVVATSGRQVVGTALLGVRPPRGWIGAVGVVPAHRKRGIARAMMDYLLEQARGLGLDSLQLEVIDANHAARALYESLGFVATRRLLILAHTPTTITPSARANGVTCQPRKGSEVLAALETLDSVKRPWGRDVAALRPLVGQMTGYLAWQDGQDAIAGACLCDAFPFQVYLATLAGRPGACAALLNALHAEHPGSTITYFNVPEDDPLLPALREAGYEESISQFEMFYTVAPQ